MRFILLFILMITISFRAEAQASFWTEAVYVTGDGGSFPQMDISGSIKLTPKTGMFIWSLVSQNWGESITGLTYSPKNWIEFGFGAGVEKHDNPLRAMGRVWIGNSKGSLFTAVEQGGSGHWYLVDGNIPLPQTNIGVGFRLQRFVGLGPRLQVTTKAVALIVVPIAWDIESRGASNSLFVLRITP